MKFDWYRLQKFDRERLIRLQQRSRLLQQIRHFFATRDFVEIEAPLMVPSPGLELHLAAFAIATEPNAAPCYLITSPEYQMKRLLCGGMERIYSLGKVFRRGELGPQHNPEFTMLEWYRAHSDWTAVADDVADLCAELCTALYGRPELPYKGRILNLGTPWPRLTVSQAMQTYAGVILRGDESVSELLLALRAAGHALKAHDSAGQPLSWDDLFFSVFLDHVEPKLAALDHPVVLCDWPLPLCALARKNPHNAAVVERFEAYVGGLELCNGFGELCDAGEQRRRLEKDAAERARRGLPVYPIDERFLSALADGMPPSGGVALGIDRLMMLLLGAAHIRDVLPFSADEL